MSWVLLAATAVVAFVDWWAVSTGQRTAEWVAKPLTMVALIATLLTMDIDVPAMHGWFIAGLVLSMIGDIFLIPKSKTWFVPGVAAFLVAHVMYLVGFTRVDLSPLLIGVGGVVMFTVFMALGPTLLAGAREESPALPFALALYMATIAAMVCVAFGTGSWVAIVGALLFAFSDLVIGFTEFVQPVPRQRLVIHSTYHAAQVALVLSLLQMA